VDAREDADGARLWTALADRLQEELSAGTYTAWFSGATAHRTDDRTLEVTVRDEFARSWIEGHFGQLIERAAHDVAGGPFGVRILAAPEAARAAGDVERPRPTAASAPFAPAVPPALEPDRTLNPRYTFDDFVIGSSNRFAHAAALAVAESPAQAYNPLVIYGSTGLGKTHLLQAIAHYVRAAEPSQQTRYVTSESFMNDFIADLQERRLEQFKSRYRGVDVLLIDDVQFFAGKERIQEEFFHTFNSLYEAGKQIVLSSDRPVKDIHRLEERLRSRFEWGLITDVQPPDLETRIAILRTRAARDGFPPADPSVLASIAQRIQTNIRELEGGFTRVVAYASLNDVPITEELVRDILRDQFPADARPVTLEQIQKAVADYFRVTVADLKGERRTQPIVYPRQIAMFLCRELTDLSLPKIGERFGGRDHTTVHYAETKIRKLLREDRGAYNLVQELTTRLRRL
jgi:chromosomal replication initiator protein